VRQLAAGLIVVVMSAGLIANQEQYPSAADHEWVGTRFSTVLEELFPMVERPGDAVGYRSVRDLYREELERNFVLSRWLDSTRAAVRMPDAASIYDQIMVLHRKNPAWRIEAIVPLLKIKQWALSAESCPAVKGQYDKFYDLTLVMRSAKDKEAEAQGVAYIRLHPLVHFILADISGGHIDLTLDDSEHPYVLWAEDTWRALQACIAKGLPNSLPQGASLWLRPTPTRWIAATNTVKQR